MVVARADEHDCIGRQPRGGERDGGRGVARRRFDDQLVSLGSADLRFDQFDVLRACDYERRAEARIACDAAECLFEQGFLAHQRQERLGPRLAADRPEPRAAAAAQDHGADRHTRAFLII